MGKFTRATKKRRKLRCALCGPTGSGKTMSALRIATGVGGRIGLIDTEGGSASLYADRFDFDALDLEGGKIERYIEAIKDAEAEGIEVLVIDSLSHAWAGRDGALEYADKVAKRSQSKNTFTAWREVTPLHNQLVDQIVHYPGHVIVTMRSKMAYELQEDDKGRKVPVKLGMAPIQRQGVEYEFDFVGDLNTEHEMIVSKSRFDLYADEVIKKPDEEVGKNLAAWLDAGTDPAPNLKPEKSDKADLEKRLRQLKIDLPPEDFATAVGIPRNEVEDYRPKTLKEAKQAIGALEKQLEALMGMEATRHEDAELPWGDSKR